MIFSRTLETQHGRQLLFHAQHWGWFNSQPPLNEPPVKFPWDAGWHAKQGSGHKFKTPVDGQNEPIRFSLLQSKFNQRFVNGGSQQFQQFQPTAPL